MKTNITLIEDSRRSSFDVTTENINRLKLTLEDIAGIFYTNTDEYRRIASDLADATKTHDDMVTHICLAKKFHTSFFPIFSREKIDVLTTLASELPFHLEAFSAKKPMISLDILKNNFQSLYGEKKNWASKETALSVKFSLWKFANTINCVYDKEKYIINLNLIEQQFAMNDETNNEFQTLKTIYFTDISKKKTEDRKIFHDMFNDSDHCIHH